MLAVADAPGRFLTVHVTDFKTVRTMLEWRRLAQREIAKVDGLGFAKAMSSIGGKHSYGFGSGVPYVRRQVMLATWSSPDAFDAFSDQPLGRALIEQGRFAWHALLEAYATHGSFHGHRPIAPGATKARGEPIGVITLGRTSPARLSRFLVHGARLYRHIRDADGVVSAVSAGLPVTGNCTVSFWDSEEAMMAFAYGAADGGHVSTVRSRPPILTEQLTTRLRPLRIEGSWDPASTQNPDRLQRLARHAENAVPSRPLC